MIFSSTGRERSSPPLVPFPPAQFLFLSPSICRLHLEGHQATAHKQFRGLILFCSTSFTAAIRCRGRRNNLGVSNLPRPHIIGGIFYNSRYVTHSLAARPLPSSLYFANIFHSSTTVHTNAFL